jgi:hypothetical protein
VAEWADPSKGEIFNAVAYLRSDLAEFSHSLDRCFKTWCHLRFLLLILNQWRKEIVVLPWRFGVCVNMKPPLGGIFPIAFEPSVQVFPPTVVAQC